MKKLPAIVLATVLFIVPVSADITQDMVNSYLSDKYAPKMFVDMDDTPWAAPAVEMLTSLGIIDGFDDGTFRPDNNITKAEFVKIVVSSFGLYDKDAAVNLIDNTPDDWYYAYVSSALDKGIASIDETGAFNANSNITREEMFDISKKAIDYAEISLTASGNPILFTDESDISPKYKDAIEYMVIGGIVAGNTDGTLLPKSNSTRAEACVMISRMLNSALENEKEVFSTFSNSEVTEVEAND